MPVVGYFDLSKVKEKNDILTHQLWKEKKMSACSLVCGNHTDQDLDHSLDLLYQWVLRDKS